MVWRFLGASSVMLLVFAVFLAGCPVNEPAAPVARDVSFAREIQPILTAKCAGCHEEGGFAVGVGIPLDMAEGRAYAALVNQPSVQDPMLSFVIPFDALNSLLYQKVAEASPPIGSTMPLFSETLSSEELGLFRDWIEQGAQNN